MGKCYHPCQGVQGAFGVGCYKSGDLYYLYCTPYTDVYRDCLRGTQTANIRYCDCNSLA